MRGGRGHTYPHLRIAATIDESKTSRIGTNAHAVPDLCFLVKLPFRNASLTDKIEVVVQARRSVAIASLCVALKTWLVAFDPQAEGRRPAIDLGAAGKEEEGVGISAGAMSGRDEVGHC